MRKPLTCVLTATMLAAGCATPYSPTPVATNFPTTQQQKLQAVAHWTTIAHDTANQLSSNLPAKSVVYIHQRDQRTPFERAFTDQLKTSLIDAGHTVMKGPEGALLVEVDTQAVRFSADRPRHRYAGAATALGGGLWVVHDVVEHTSPGAGMMLTLAAVDALTWFQSEIAPGAIPRTEILISASVSSADRYVARNTSVYYIAEEDHGTFDSLYAPAETMVKTFAVKGAE